MRKIATLAAIVCLAPAGLGFGPPALIESSQALAPLYSEQVPAIQRFQPPAVGAPSVLLLEQRSGVVAYVRGATTRRPMASVTKMMTALLALERGRLEQRVKVNVDSSQLGDSSVMGLRPGEELSLEDLLYGLLLPSGNDAALAIAEHSSGSVAKFVDLMNQRAVVLGMADTHFANPHGLDAPDHYSTAADLVLLAKTAMANPTFATIVATKERVVRGKLATYQLRNTNRLLGVYPGLDGIKTGSTDAAGQCLVATAQRGEERPYTVVLGATERFSDTQALLDYFYGSFLCQRLPLPTSPFAALPPVPTDETAAADSAPRETHRYGDFVVSDSPWDCRPAWQRRWLRAELGLSEIGDGQQPITVTYFVGDQSIAERQAIPR